MSETPNRKEAGRPSYTLDELLSQSDFSTPRTEEEQAWLDGTGRTGIWQCGV